MPTNMQPETVFSRFKLCLIANFASILLMFASAVVTGYVSRLYGPQPIVAETIEADWLLSSYAIATKLSFFLGLPAFTIAFFGLLKTKLWGRRLFTALMIAWGLQAIAFGIFNLSMTWGLSALFANLALLSAGAVLALSYFTPLAARFESSGLSIESHSRAGLAPA
ncbi:MAG: hypothetical protein ACKO8U_16305 [Pirellula sp.]